MRFSLPLPTLHWLGILHLMPIIYEHHRAWFQFGLPYRVKVRIESGHRFDSHRMQETAGLASGRSFYLNAAANPTRQTFAHELGHLFFRR